MLFLLFLSIFFLSFKIAKKVIDVLNRIQRSFLWDVKGEEHIVPWVRWVLVCTPYVGGADD